MGRDRAEDSAGPQDSAIDVTTVEDGVARLSWRAGSGEGWMAAVDVVRREVAAALEAHGRVEAVVDADDEQAQRVATWSGMRREGVMRGVGGDRVVYARLATDTPVGEPGGFRALLNSFLPRKRAIAQMLVRDDSETPRVLLCGLTYKADWDLPGGVVEVGESPRDAVGREVEEELDLQITPGRLLLTDWLPPWGGWDDALCLVFDGGRHSPDLLASVVKQDREIREASFCTMAQVHERAADFTARRVEAALASLRGEGPGYTESGRPSA